MNKIKGFTLIELLIVIAVLSILAIAAVTTYTGVRLKALRNEAYTNLESLRLLMEQFYADNGEYAPLNGTIIGTCGKDNDNIGDIQNYLPGFKPGSGLHYSYCIEKDIKLDGSPQAPCFRASAFGNSKTPVDGDVFRIDCNNNRNF